MIFNCTYNISLANQLFYTHHKLSIYKEDFCLFSEVFLQTVKEFEFSDSDSEYISKLLNKLSKDIIIRHK